jgi:hypothetical protein
MYGMIHQAARDLAVSRLGQREWDALVERNGLSGRFFIGMEYYSDTETLDLVRLISERLGCGMAETLDAFGRCWIEFAGASAYGRALRMAGGDLATFLENLDRMHASIKSSMPHAKMPGLRGDRQHGRRDPGALQLRAGGFGGPSSRGILAAVAERFGERARISHHPTEGGVVFVLARERG